MLHPEQDRVLTLREFARLQGFPDYYRFCGTVKERFGTYYSIAVKIILLLNLQPSFKFVSFHLNKYINKACYFFHSVVNPSN